MRVLIVAALAAFALTRAAVAQEYPWCAIQWDGDGGEITTCGYMTQPQCMDTVAGGVGGYCRPNPRASFAPQSQPLQSKKNASIPDGRPGGC